MPTQSRKPQPAVPRPPVPAPPPVVTPPVVPIPAATPVPVGVAPVAPIEAQGGTQMADVPPTLSDDDPSANPDGNEAPVGDDRLADEPASEPPPFNPDDPHPGQSIRQFVPHSGYTSFAYGLMSFDIDPDTDCITRVYG